MSGLGGRRLLCECKRCKDGHRWLSSGEPKVCPKCHSPYWDVERKKKSGIVVTGGMLKKCATCGKEGDMRNMKVCMDSRPMHRYVCDAKCMEGFYEIGKKEVAGENHVGENT